MGIAVRVAVNSNNEPIGAQRQASPSRPVVSLTRTIKEVIASPARNLRRLDDRKRCRELRQIGCLTGGPERKRESSDELLDVVVSKKR